jgi:hypothetical protein
MVSFLGSDLDFPSQAAKDWLTPATKKNRARVFTIGQEALLMDIFLILFSLKINKKKANNPKKWTIGKKYAYCPIFQMSDCTILIWNIARFPHTAAGL